MNAAAERGRLGAQDGVRALAAWAEHDGEHALHVADRDAIRATEAARALVLELLAGSSASRDLYSACARLGRLLAERGASPSLAATTIDGAVRALEHVKSSFDRDRIPSARSSLAEGFVAVVVDGERALARSAWEYPACAVRLGPTDVGLAAGFPSDDPEALGDWAARVALAASRDGYRQATLSGADAARSELASALGLVGIRSITSIASSNERAGRSRWFSFFRR